MKIETWRIIGVGAIAAAVSAILVLGGQVGEYMPALVTAEELEEVRIELAGGVSSNAANVLGIQRRDTNRSVAELRMNMRVREDKGQAPTKEQLDLMRLYEEELIRIDDALRKLQ